MLRKLLPVLAGAFMVLVLAGGAIAAQDPFFVAPATVADFGAAARPFGVAAGDFDEDGKVDLVVGRTTGNVAFVKGNGNGTFAAPTTFAWKQAFFNAWAVATGDVNGDGNLDVIWGATANSPGTAPFVVNDGEVRAFLGNGDGTFVQTPYFVSGVLHNAGLLLGDVGTDAASLAAADVDGDSDLDVVAGAIDGTNAVVKLLRNNGGGVFTIEATPVLSQTQGTSLGSPAYFPPTSAAIVNSPWGLAFGDADGDGDRDLFVGDRALYVYLYENNGTGTFALRTGNDAVTDRPNVYLGHDAFRAAVGNTESLAAGDVNGDGRADVFVGIQASTQTPASNVAHDGKVLLDLSTASGHTSFGSLGDVGTNARGLNLADVNGDLALDLIGAEYDGKISLLRQLPPVDADGDGVSDYVDNALGIANAPRLDMNTDASVNYRDQLDNDFDTVLGNPEDPSTWQRLGDPADDDDDNDGIADGLDNCPFVASDGGDVDTDGIGNACDPLDNRDGDDDGLPDGPVSGDPGYAAAHAAAVRWSTGTTHFVIRIDALGRFFQNEFTQLLSDGASLNPADWEAKKKSNYNGAGDPGPATVPDDLPGGKEVPVSVVVIPKQLWTDPEVIDWINDRNDSDRLEIGQHGTYHVDYTGVSDWKDMTDRNFFSCELCGLSEAESFESMRVGYDTLLGNYGNKWVAESGATGSSAKIDWSASAHPLASYAPPFNTSDTVGREALGQLGFKGFSASVFEEGETGTWGPIFSPEGSHHEQFDQFGMFHASADLELEPPETVGGVYDPAAYEAYLESNVDQGGLTTWLIEEVEWSGRPCNEDDRLGTCNGGSNRENNTVYRPRWDGWLQMLDFVKSYPGGVAMTMGEVALARAYDNAPTVANPGQADSDHDGIGNVIDGATLAATTTGLTRNEAGTLAATLQAGNGNPIAGQVVTFTFDANGDGTAETSTATTTGDGTASVTVTATRPVGPTSYTVDWDGVRATASATGNLTVGDKTSLALDSGNPASGQITDSVTVGATLVDTNGVGLSGRTVTFTIGSSTAQGTTDTNGHATASVSLAGPVGPATLQASFAGDGPYGPSSASAAFEVTKEDTTLALTDARKQGRATTATTTATLSEADSARLAGRTVSFYAQTKVRNQVTWALIGSATTNGNGVASFAVPAKHLSKAGNPIQARFVGDASYLASTGNAKGYL